MDIQKLCKMANQIGAFFEVEPERKDGIEGVTSHICRFWEPRMRRELLAHVDETGAKELMPIVLEAIKANRERLQPKTAA